MTLYAQLFEQNQSQLEKSIGIQEFDRVKSKLDSNTLKRKPEYSLQPEQLKGFKLSDK